MKRPLIFSSILVIIVLMTPSQEISAQEISPETKDKYHDALTKFSNGSCLDFTAFTSSTPVSCNGFDDGEACVSEPTDGVGPYEYFWLGETSTSNCLSNVDAGSYIVIITDLGQAGVSCSWQITVFEPTALGVISMGASPPSCVDACDGTANPVVVGGNGDYSFQYDSGEMTQSASMLCNPFELTMTDSVGCFTDTTFVFPDAPDTIQINAIVTDNICFGILDGAIDMTLTGGTGGFDIVWTGPNMFMETIEDIPGLEPGVYDVLVTDDNGCTQTGSFTIQEAIEIEIDAIVVDVICFADSTGSIDITVGGGNPGYIFSWTGPQGFTSMDEDIFNLKAGVYDLTVTDLSSCEKDTSITVAQNDEILFAASVTHNLCADDSTGAIDITVTSFLGVASYSWMGPASFSSADEDISGLVPGAYTLTVTDLGGCEKDTTIVVGSPPALQLDIVLTDILCNGDSTGAIELTISGGIPSFSIDWSGPSGFTSSSEDISQLIAGDYLVVVTDGNNCQADSTVTIAEPPTIMVDDSITDAFCASGFTGSIVIDISGGTGLYTTIWSGPNSFSSNDEDIFSLEAGLYDLLITDENSCQMDFNFEVGQPDSILIDFVKNDLDCAGDSSGSIDITVTGGTGAYTYLWNGPIPFTSMDEDVSGLAAGIYSILVTDENNCTSSALIELFEPSPFVLDTTVTHVSCAGEMDGAIDLEVSGGTGSYLFDWDNDGVGDFDDTEDLSGLFAGIYNVVILDENLCSDSLSVEVLEPDSIMIIGDITHISCNGDMDGAIDITVTLGAGGYVFSWVGPMGYTNNAEDISGLFSGVYVVTVTDANMCSQMNTFVVEQNEEIVFAADIVQIVCAGDSTGSIDITAIGGQGSFTYSWTGPNGFVSDQEDITDLIAGTYILIAEDLLGCTEQQAFVITEPLPLMVTAVLQDPLCFGEENGDIDIIITGGTPDFFIEWVGPNGFNASGLGIDISDLEAGDYSLTIRDFFDCEFDTTFTLSEPTDLQAVLNISEPSCNLDNGSVISTVSGGTVTGSYTYYWLDGAGDTIATTADLNGVGPGSYTFIVLDDNACEVMIPFELSNDVGVITALIEDVSCFGEMDGSIDVEVTGLTGMLTVQWTGPSSFTASVLDIAMLQAGEYIIMIEDEIGCTLVESYTVGTPAEITIDANIENESCEDLENGSIDITVSGGQGELVYSWTDGGPFTSNDEDLSGLLPGTYTVTVTDTSSCSNMASFVVQPAPSYSITSVITDIDCAGENSGAIDLSVVPGLTGASYSWMGPNGYGANTEDINGLFAGEYFISIITAEFCLLTDSFEVDENEPLQVDLDILPSVCGMGSGSVSANVTGGEAALDYNYLFYTLPLNTVVGITSSVGGLDGGLYGYTISDDNNCEASGTFIISDEFGTLDAVVQGLTCVGSDDGAIDVTITGMVGLLTIEWVGPNGFTSSVEDISGLEQGIYTVTITDENGCVLGDSYEIVDGAAIDITGVITHVSCFGEDDGAIDMEFSGGQTPFDIDWTGPDGFIESQEDINDLAPGDYIVVITDLNDCQGTATFTVLEPDLLDVQAFITPVSCNGEMDGAIDINILGGTGPFDINWIGPSAYTSSFEDISGLEAGVYTLSISDINDCLFTADYEVIQPDIIDVALIQLVNSSCDLAIGLVEVEASGGNSPYTYIWTNSLGFEVSDDALADDLSADTYTVLVEDEDGCTATQDYIVSNQEAVLTAIVDSVSCNGLSDGAIDLTVTGTITGVADTLWVGPGGFTATSEDISGLLAGDYTITIEDETSCVFTETFTVFQPDTIMVLGLAEPVNCNGSADGAIQIDVTGGVGTYNYAWTGPVPFTSDQEDISGLEPGIYNLTVTDIIPCSVDFSIEIMEPAEIDIVEETLSDPTCIGLDDGIISILVSGGNGGYEYQWTGPGFTSSLEDISALGPGQYNITVTDDSSCVESASFFLAASQAIELEVAIDSIACNGDEDAAIDITVSGDNGGFGFNWDGPDPFSSMDEDISNLIPGGYTIFITDALGCEIDSTITIDEPELLVILNPDVTDITCNGDNNGSISLDVTGGQTAYTYSWTGPASFTADIEDISGLFAGDYTLLITDGNDCIATDDFTIDEPLPISITTDGLNDAECENTSDGSLLITTSGGNSGYLFDWIGPDGFDLQTEDLIGVLPGDYILTVVDQLGCMASEVYTIGFQVAISVDAGDYSPQCNGQELTLNGQGGPVGSDFEWSTPSGPVFSSELITDVQTSPTNDVFVLTIVNGNCLATDTAYIDILTAPEPDAGDDQEVFLEDMIVLGGDPTSIDASSYSWSPSQLVDDPTLANPIYMVVGEQLFIVTVIGTNGCIGFDEVLITINPTLEIPDGITPNGDNRNETWIIQNTILFPDMQVRVFNRWGDELWTSEIGYPEEWDGRYDGNVLPVGTYYYVIELNDTRFPDAITGPITIFR